MKVLVIEDDGPVRDTLRDMLELTGYEVVTAADGREGLELLNDEIDLIISDLAMPKLDGFGVLAAVRENKKYQTLPFIVLTAKTERSDLRRAMELGADDYITKPFTSKEVLAAIEARVVRQKPLVERLEAYKDLHQNLVSASWDHELLTPLNSIMSGAEFLINEADTIQPEEIREIARIIHRGGLRELGLARKILLHFQLERYIAGQEKPKTVRIEASEIIRQVASKVAGVANRLIDLDVQVQTGRVELPRDWLDTAVEELVENALKFSQSGTAIRLAGRPQDSFYILDVSNHGGTLSPEQVRSIAPFVQFERGKQEQQGLGLGLANVMRLAAIAGGKLDIQSSPDGKGVLAQLRLPLAKF